MNDNYYEEMIDEIRSFIDENKIELARFKIQQELKMPYIPNDIEILLNDLLKDANSKVELEYSLSQSQVEQLILSDNLAKQLKGVDYLKQCNCLNFIDIIQQFFNTNKSLNLQGLMIDTLINQQINYEFIIDNEKIKIEFNPRYIESSYETDGFIKSYEILNELLGNDNPSFLKLCLDMLNVESFLMLPFAIDEDEAINYCLSIIEYVAHSLGDMAIYDNIKGVPNYNKCKNVELLCIKV